MTKTLILMRHAKSDWSTDAASDHARPLNPRGQAAARALGDWLRSNGWMPDQLLCSSALRTRQTLAGLGIDAPASYLDALYHAEPAAILNVLQAADMDTVLLLAHNPGIAECAAMLVSDPPEHPQFYTYPTGATLVVRFDIDTWRALQWHTGTALDFVIPRDLAS